MLGFFSSDSGNAGIIAALAAVPLIASLGTAVDVSKAGLARTRLQELADGAALAMAKKASAKADLSSSDQANVRAEGDVFLAQRHGEPILSKDVQIDTASRIISTRLSSSVETLYPLFAAEIRFDVIAKATYGSPPPNICLLALSRTAKDSVSIKGSASFTGNNCAVHSNSSASPALSAQKKAAASEFCAPGASQGSFSPSAKAGCDQVADPFATVQFPAKTGSCLPPLNSLSLNSITLKPGRYCGGLKLSSKQHVTLQPGTYEFAGGSLDMSGQSVLEGTDVSLLFVDDISTLSVSGGAEIHIAAPSKGPYKDIAIGAAKGNAAKDASVLGTALVDLKGAVYLPGRALELGGNATFGTATSRGALIAETFAFTGNSTTVLNASYPGLQHPEIALIK